jgi:hypothetical protein
MHYSNQHGTNDLTINFKFATKHHNPFGVFIRNGHFVKWRCQAGQLESCTKPNTKKPS